MPSGMSVTVSCGIFRAELEYLAREGRLSGEVVFLDASLHVNFDRLKSGLVQTLEGLRRKGCEARVLYGACHPEMAEILERFGARRMAASNCLEALVGGEEMHRLTTERKTFFLSVGWINNWEKMFAIGTKDFDLDFRALLSTYERAVVFETGVLPLDEERLLRFQELTRLPVERRPICLDLLADQLHSF